MAEGIYYVSTGVAFGRLWMSVKTLAGTSCTYTLRPPAGPSRLGAWESRFTNLSPQAMFTGSSGFSVASVS